MEEPLGENEPVLIGTSRHIRSIEAEARQAARSSAKVLITGESGVGKEVVARLTHQHSVRHSRPFVIVNCAGVPDTLLASEFFGHTRGSFTDAHADRPGLLQQADGGTVFLDEVGEMSVQMQGLLLRFLETGEIERVGAGAGRDRVDVRVVAATNRVLPTRIAEGSFREDLYYRLKVIHISITPLRERREDIEPLLRHFLATFSRQYSVPVPRLSPATLAQLSAYDWPGNARELKNVAERVMVRALPEIDAGTLTALIGPSETLSASRHISDPADATSVAERLFAQLVERNESFWAVVYAPFKARELKRDEVRGVMRLGLERTGGSYKELLRLFGLPPTDYKRLLNFLKKSGCHLPYQDFRAGRASRASLHSDTD